MKPLFGFLIAVLSCCLYAQERAVQGIQGEGSVRDFVADYNAGDIDAMLERVTEEISWLSTVGSITQVVTQGKDELKEALAGQLDGPELRSEIVSLIGTGNTVAVLEKAYWRQRGVTRFQCAMSVYQLKGGLIDSVMYFPSDAC